MHTQAMTDGRWTDFGTKLIYLFFLKKKAGIIIFLKYHLENTIHSYLKHYQNMFKT